MWPPCLDLQQQCGEVGDELCESGTVDAVLAVWEDVGLPDNLLGLILTTTPEVHGLLFRRKALIWSQLGGGDVTEINTVL